MILGHTITYLSAFFGIGTSLLITYLLLKNAKGRQSYYWLTAWILTLNISIQVFGVYIIAQTDAAKALRGYQLAAFASMLYVSFYIFAKGYVNKKLSIINKGVILIIASSTFIVGMFFPNDLFTSVTWDPVVSFYLYNIGENILMIAPIYASMALWVYGSLLLGLEYRKNKSAIERNRLKYLILGSLAPILGIGLVSIPIGSIRKYPFDMWATSIGTILIAYAILRYRLLNISVVIKKGLVYSVLTAVVTGVYLFFALVIQYFLGIATNVSIPAALTTALAVAIIYQPLQDKTQELIDALFFRKKYNPQLLISEYADKLREIIDPNELSKSVIDMIVNTMQIKSGYLYLRDPNNDTFYLLYSNGDVLNHIDEVSLHNPVVQIIYERDDVVSKYEISDFATQLFSDLNSTIAIPLTTKEELLAIMFLGDKLSDEVYSLDEYQLLKILGDQAAVAFQNSLYVEELKRGKEKLQEVLEHERELDKIKSEFVSIASHNLRTPLTTIEGYLAILRKDMERFTNQDRQALDRLEIAVIKLNQITERLLTISTLEKGEVALSRTPVDVVKMTLRIVSDYQEFAKDQGDELVFIPPDVQIPEIQLDRLKITLVLENLIENAIKFTEQGHIDVGIQMDDKYIELYVKDNGEGIPAQEVDNIFSKFYQGGKTMVATPGMGAGLYISRMIVKAHGGDIWFESQEGQGSLFTFNLPIDNPSD